MRASLLGALLLLVALGHGGTGCSALAPVRIDVARTGETVVRVARPMTPTQIAERVWGDAALGKAVAGIAGAPADRPLPAGTVLVLPSRDEIEGRLAAERAADDLEAQAMAAADAGRWREAADLFGRALDRSPGRLDARYNRGLALMRAGELPEATSVLGAVAAARPDDAPSRYAFGSVLRQRRAWERALVEFRAAARLAPRDPNAAFAAARTLEDLDRDRDAVRAWKRFLDDFADDPLAADARRRLAAAEERLRGEIAP